MSHLGGKRTLAVSSRPQQFARVRRSNGANIARQEKVHASTLNRRRDVSREMLVVRTVVQSPGYVEYFEHTAIGHRDDRCLAVPLAKYGNNAGRMGGRRLRHRVDVAA